MVVVDDRVSNRVSAGRPVSESKVQDKRIRIRNLAEGEGFEPPEAHHLSCFQDMEGDAVFELGPMVPFPQRFEKRWAPHWHLT